MLPEPWSMTGRADWARRPRIRHNDGMSAPAPAVSEALRREVEKLASMRAQGEELPADLDQRLAAVERRLDEQEESLRHVLTMMIDYFESQATRAAA